jgi:hypothetical protein
MLFAPHFITIHSDVNQKCGAEFGAVRCICGPSGGKSTVPTLSTESPGFIGTSGAFENKKSRKRAALFT